MSVISLTDITAAYGKKGVLEHFNLDITQGEFVMLIGTSGCGKTTALKLMNGLLKPNAGRVMVNGKDLADTDLTGLRRKLGYVVQETGLFPHLTIEKNISYVADLSRKKDKKAIRERVGRLLELVELPEEVRRRYPDELSGGQKQRVGIARALMNSPEILLMDEPFGAVDEITRRRLQEEIGRIHRRQKETIVFVTHDIDEALRLGTRIVVMDEGRIIQDGTPEEIRANPATDFVRKLISDRA
nr:ABC transporter ATP-binding protein [uncultured Eisenbergiella sp.]